jgi:uncharacterized protein
MIDRKGIFSYILITFGITYLIEGILILAGFRVTVIPAAYGQYVIAGAMWVPAVGALITTRFVTHEKLSSLNLRFGPSWKPYLVSAVVIPLGYVVTYLLTWLLGLGAPDWHLKSFYELVAATGADMTKAPDPTVLLVSFVFLSCFISPWVNSIFGLGEELGWRGYLLPRLMPLGKGKAYLLLGIIWGLWHAPLITIGFAYPGYPILGIVMMICLTTALGLFINELTLRYKSAILAGWIHGVFNSQAYGIWRTVLFPNVQPLLGGIMGLVGVCVLLAIGLATQRWVGRVQADRKVDAAAAYPQPS